MDFILAHSRYRRRKYPEAIRICDSMLEKNGKDDVFGFLLQGSLGFEMSVFDQRKLYRRVRN
jgi:hypothetical protein